MSLYVVAVAFAGAALLQGCGDPTYEHSTSKEKAQKCDALIKFVVGNTQQCCDVITKAKDETDVDTLIGLYCVDDCASKQYKIQRAKGDTCINAMKATVEGVNNKASKLIVDFEFIFKGESAQIAGSDGEKDLPAATSSVPASKAAPMVLAAAAPGASAPSGGQGAVAAPAGFTIKVEPPVAAPPASPPSPSEKRMARDGNHYTKAEFEMYYGGLREWEAAAPPAAAGANAFVETKSNGESELVKRAREARRVRQ